MKKRAAQIALSTCLCASLFTGTLLFAGAEEEFTPEPLSVVVDSYTAEEPVRHEQREDAPAPVEHHEEAPVSEPPAPEQPAPVEWQEDEPASEPDPDNYVTDDPSPAPETNDQGGDPTQPNLEPLPEPEEEPVVEEPFPELEPELPTDEELPPVDEALTENPAVAQAMKYARKSMDKRIEAIADRLGMGSNYRLEMKDDNFCDALAVYAIRHGQTENYPYAVEIVNDGDHDELLSIYWSLNRINAASTDSGNTIIVKRLSASKRYDLNGSAFDRLTSGEYAALVEALA